MKKCQTVDYRSVIKFFTRKALNTTEISKKLNSVYKDNASSPSALINLNTHNVPSKIHLERVIHPPSLLIKTLKSYKGSKYVIDKSLFIA